MMSVPTVWQISPTLQALSRHNSHPTSVGVVNFTTTTTHKTLRGPRGGAIMCNSEYAQAIDKAVFPGMQGGPLMHTITAKAVCFEEALRPSFTEYNKQIVKNAKVLAETLMNNGIRLVSGGTDNHLMLIDLTNQHITGLEAEVALGKAAITVNKNTIPNETKSPFVTSGLRVGTPAVTSRGMKEAEMRQIGNWISVGCQGYQERDADPEGQPGSHCDGREVPDLPDSIIISFLIFYLQGDFGNGHHS